LRRARRPADPEHPFGHGLQLYFWTFVVAVMIFGIGAVVAFIEGLHKLGDPHPVEHVYVNYIVLGVSMLFEIGSWTVAFREFRRSQGGRSWLAAARRSKDPTVFTVLFEDTAALLGLIAAFIGVALADVLGLPIFDGLASLAIGAILVITAAFLAYESQSLLTGEAAQPETRSGIAQVASQTPGVVGINEILTMHFGPQDLLVALSLDFDDAIPAGRVEAAVALLERRLKAEFPEVARVFVEAKGFDEHERRKAPDPSG
jgi:cation diffusion facilitator family transporter